MTGQPSDPRFDGQRFVLTLYGIIVGIAGVLGLVLGSVLDVDAGPRLFFVIPLPPTPPGFAVFGTVTVAVALGIPLAAVVYLSRRTETATAGDD